MGSRNTDLHYCFPALFSVIRKPSLLKKKHYSSTWPARVCYYYKRFQIMKTNSPHFPIGFWLFGQMAAPALYPRLLSGKGSCLHTLTEVPAQTETAMQQVLNQFFYCIINACLSLVQECKLYSAWTTISSSTGICNNVTSRTTHILLLI